MTKAVTPKKRRYQRHPESLVGQKFGRLTVLEDSGKRFPDGNRFCVCVCDCSISSEVRPRLEVRRGSLFGEKTKSCGCLQRDATREKNTKHGFSTRSRRASEYSIWNKMRGRCKNPKDESYHRYGGRGIFVCERWKKFEFFLEDMGEKPSPKHTLERVDNNGGYCPENCVWASRHQQARNKRTNRFIEFQGKSLVACDWEKELGLSRGLISMRLSRGWSVEDALLSGPYHRKSKGRGQSSSKNEERNKQS